MQKISTSKNSPICTLAYLLLQITVLAMLEGVAHADVPCFEWVSNTNLPSSLFPAEGAAPAVCSAYNDSTVNGSDTWTPSAGTPNRPTANGQLGWCDLLQCFPNGTCGSHPNSMVLTEQGSNCTPPCPPSHPCLYVSTHRSAGAQNGTCCTAISDPINPANGGVYSNKVDLALANTLKFAHFYNSTDTGTIHLSAGWRHSFSRQIAPKYADTTYVSYAASADNSSIYPDEASACVSGFAQIQVRVSTWSNATASYSNGQCTLRVSGVSIGTLPILSASLPLPDPGTTGLIGFDAIRDDGQLISFTLQGGSIVAPPSVGLKLQQTSSGYTLQDENDSVETYDANGRLLSVATRAGVVQTMGYDTSNRLSTVTDSFGHSLSLNYDSQGRVSSVRRQ